MCVCVCVCVPEGSAFSFSHPLRIVQPRLLVLLHSWPNIYSRCSWGGGRIGPLSALGMCTWHERQRHTSRETHDLHDREKQREREREKVALACVPARLSLQTVRLSCFKNCDFTPPCLKVSLMFERCAISDICAIMCTCVYESSVASAYSCGLQTRLEAID